MVETVPAFAVGRSQLARLLEVILALQSSRCPNARQLAERCEVSRRTIYRDLGILERAGIPVRFRRDRLGYELAVQFFQEGPALHQQELVALAMLIGSAPLADELGLRRRAEAALEKLIVRVPAPQRGPLLDLAHREDQSGRLSKGKRDRTDVFEPLLRGYLERSQVRAWLRDQSGDDLLVTKLSPYRMIFDGQHWCVVGRSSWHRKVRRTSLALIDRALLTSDPFQVPPRFRLKGFLDGTSEALAASC